MNNNKISELEQLNILLESDQVLTFENGRYINEVRECIMALLTKCNVSMNKVNNVICSLTKIDWKDTPSDFQDWLLCQGYY